MSPLMQGRGSKRRNARRIVGGGKSPLTWPLGILLNILYPHTYAHGYGAYVADIQQEFKREGISLRQIGQAAYGVAE